MGACLNGSAGDLDWHCQRAFPQISFCFLSSGLLHSGGGFTWSDVLRMMGCLMLADATTPYIIAMFIKICCCFEFAL